MDYPSVLAAENGTFTALITQADPSTAVPTCPGWTLRELLRHLGRGDRWCARIVADRSTGPVDPKTVADGVPPDDRDGQGAWLRAGPRLLLDAVAATGEDTAVWTFLGPRPAAWWIRRRLHETVVHRADAALALGVRFDVDPEVAADAITEHLERTVIRAAESTDDPALAAGQSLHLHATDTDGEWTLHGTADGIAVDREHGKATVALRGPARDLLVALVRRATIDDLDVQCFGDRAVWTTWLDRTPF